MDPVDVAVKVVSLSSAVLGSIAIGLEQLSLRRRLYAETMRQLQLVKLRYEIEKLIRDGGLSPALYDSVARCIPDSADLSLGSTAAPGVRSPSPVPDLILLLSPTLIATILTMFLHELVAIGCHRPSLTIFALWILGQGVVSGLAYPWALRRITSTVVRRIGSLVTGVAVFFLMGTIIVVAYPAGGC